MPATHNIDLNKHFHTYTRITICDNMRLPELRKYMYVYIYICIHESPVFSRMKGVLLLRVSVLGCSRDCMV